MPTRANIQAICNVRLDFGFYTFPDAKIYMSFDWIYEQPVRLPAPPLPLPDNIANKSNISNVEVENGQIWISVISCSFFYSNIKPHWKKQKINKKTNNYLPKYPTLSEQYENNINVSKTISIPFLFLLELGGFSLFLIS